MSTCAVCSRPLDERHQVLELAATRPPYAAERWPLCDTHARLALAPIRRLTTRPPEAPDA